MCAPTYTHLRIKLKCSILLTVRNRVMDLEVSVSKNKKGILHSNNGRIRPRYSDIPLIFDWFDCRWTLYLLEKMRWISRRFRDKSECTYRCRVTLAFAWPNSSLRVLMSHPACRQAVTKVWRRTWCTFCQVYRVTLPVSIATSILSW